MVLEEDATEGSGTNVGVYILNSLVDRNSDMTICLLELNRSQGLIQCNFLN